MKNFQRITRKQLTDAREAFSDLLGQKTREDDWQKFFVSHPYVLSASLPLALQPDHIVPTVRPERTEPDFVIYPWDTAPIPFYGVIELKRPDSPVVTITPSHVALLTIDAQTAIAQSEDYARARGYQLRNANRSSLCLGNQSYIFVIMGLKEELGQKLGEKIYRQQIGSRLPNTLQLLPYDVLYEQFSAQIPAQIMILIPSGASVNDDRSVKTLLADLDYEERHYWRAKGCG